MAGYERAEHALIIGSGMAGMCAARALSRHYRKVTLIERDRLPAGPQHRSGVPQSHHAHVLLLRGLNELEALFPGFSERLMASGALRLDIGEQFGHYSEWGWSPRGPTGVAPISSNRLSIEHTVRELLFSQVSNVAVREQTRVRQLAVERSADGLRVVGVDVSDPAGNETILADLVVDTSGRNGKLPQWLAALELPEPPTEIVDSDSAYASRFYRAPDPWPSEWWWRGLIVDSKAPHEGRGAMLLPCGGDKLVLVLIGSGGDHPPSDEAGFAAYTRSLRTPYVAEVINRCEPTSPIHGYKGLWNRWRHFERWQAQLPGFLCMGDSLVAFNPFHGQGMTVAAVSAATLERTLERVGPDAARLPPAFYRANFEFANVAWDVATMIDFCWPTTQGQRPWKWHFLEPIAGHIARSIYEDAALKRALGKVFHLVEPSSVLYRPSVMFRLIYSVVRRALLGPVVPHDFNPMLPKAVDKQPSSVAESAG